MSQACTRISPSDLMILPCSGASSVGQLSHMAAAALSREGAGRMYCLAGIGAGLEPFLAAAQQAERLIVVDGCRTACGRSILEKAGIDCRNHLVITDLGIAREDGLQAAPDSGALQLIKDAIMACSAEVKPIIRLGGCTCGI
jgi:uncharacterized metal-binding protein